MFGAGGKYYKMPKLTGFFFGHGGVLCFQVCLFCFLLFLLVS